MSLWRVIEAHWSSPNLTAIPKISWLSRKESDHTSRLHTSRLLHLTTYPPRGMQAHRYTYKCKFRRLILSLGFPTVFRIKT